MRAMGGIFAALLGLAAIGDPAAAAPITINGITADDLSIFRDNVSPNDVGITPGDRLQLFANIPDGSVGYSSAGIFIPAPGSPAPPLTQALSVCLPTSVDPFQCARSAKFDPGRLDGTWSFELKSPAGAIAVFPLPPVAPILLTPVPFPRSVTMTPSASGVNPTISWTRPGGFVPDILRIFVYDRSHPLAPGVADSIHFAALPPTATSYTIPATLSTGKSLIVGDKYSIDFQMVTTRDGGTNPANENALTRSSSLFDFTAKPGGPSSGLPIVGLDGVYHFTIDKVGPSSVTFIDPAVAVGYKYATGAGDPNFASVILPDVGDGVFDLSYLSTSVSLDAGVQYFFPAGGVADFTVTGIEPSAGLDPADTLAFVTGLTFAADGSFTGTMTPLTEEVPEPASLALLAAGLLGCAAARRRKPPLSRVPEG